MEGFTKQQIIYLRNLLSEEKNKYKEEWEKVKAPLMEAIKKFREKLLQIFEEEKEEDRKKKAWEDAEKEFKEEIRRNELKLGEMFIFRVGYGEETWEKRKNLLEKIKNLPPNKEEMYGILEKLVENKDKFEGSATYWTILLTVFYPEWYFPADENVIGESIQNIMNIQGFWGGDASKNTIRDGIDLYKTLYDIKKDLEIDTMLEVGFYLYKHKKYKPEEEETSKVKTTESQAKTASLLSILNALETKPFLILAGISGTGKTQIARLIAGTMSEEKENKDNKEVKNETY